jgi:hypothetical protein
MDQILINVLVYLTNSRGLEKRKYKVGPVLLYLSNKTWWRSIFQQIFAGFNASLIYFDAQLSMT